MVGSRCNSCIQTCNNVNMKYYFKFNYGTFNWIVQKNTSIMKYIHDAVPRQQATSTIILT